MTYKEKMKVVETALNQNIGNRITEELATGFYTKVAQLFNEENNNVNTSTANSSDKNTSSQ